MLDCSVMITSHDSFADIWPPALECLRRFWPDCPWPVRTLSNFSPWGECPVLVGDDRGWCANLMRGLELAPSEYVMLWLEDMLLCDPVDTAACVAAYETMRENPKIGAILVGPGPQTFEPLRHTIFGRTLTSSMYRVSTSPTIWKTEYLKRLLAFGSTPWEFELRGTRAAETMPEEVWLVNAQSRPVGVAFTAITRGEAEQGALIWLDRIGVQWVPNRPIRGFEKGQKWPKGGA